MPSRRIAVALLAGLALTVPAAFLTPDPAAADSKVTGSKIKDWKAGAAKVDDLIAARWRTEKDLVVAPMADDAEFLRRASIDLIGTIPTELVPQTDEGEVSVSARLASGTRVERSEQIAQRLEELIEVNVPEMTTMISSAGGGGFMGGSSSSVNVTVKLKSRTERTRTSDACCY